MHDHLVATIHAGAISEVDTGILGGTKFHNGRGMMTAEQSLTAREWLCSGGGGHEDGEDGIRACTLSMEAAIELMDEFAESRTAAQLAEKEREIERLTQDAACEAADWSDIHTGAEIEIAQLHERLQEAQVEVRKFMDVANNNARERNEAVDRETDLAERLQQREAELEQRWIAVGERLPKEDERVLIWYNEGRIDGWRTRFGSICGGHWRPDGGNGNFDDQVTYWQPLPSPPKEGSDGNKI